MDHYGTFNDVLSNLFQEIMAIEGRALITEEFSDSIFMPYGKCIDKIVSLLSKIMHCKDIDVYGTSDIDYFIYELDFGKKWPEYSAYDEHGALIPMRTPEELYDYLIKENFED